jgi:hypothetical protein
MKAERRFYPGSKLELRAAGEGLPKIVGHCAVFNSLSEDLGGWREQIAPGAFSGAIAEPDDVRALFNHDEDYVLGRNLSGTLKLSEDGTGLFMEVDPPDATWARDLIVSIQRGDISGQSFSFRCENDTWEKMPDGTILRTLLEVELFDVGPVTYPAYRAATVGVRSLSDYAGAAALLKGDTAEADLTDLLTRRTRLREISL